MRCEDCGCMLACEVEHVCECPEHNGAHVALCGGCGASHKDRGHDCEAVRD